MTADNQPRCALVTFAGRDFRVHGEYAMRFDVRFDVHQHFSAAYSMTVWVAGREPTELHKAAKVVVCPWIYERYRLPLDRLACAKAIVTLEVLINGEQAALDNPRTPTRRPPISRIRRVVQSLIDAGAGSSDPPSLRFWREYGR